MSSEYSIGINPSPRTLADGVAAPASAIPGAGIAPERMPGIHAGLLEDAIHESLGIGAVPAARRQAVAALRQNIRARLQASPAGADGGQYEITLRDGSTHLRTAQEAELHVLLQSQVCIAEGRMLDPADCIDPVGTAPTAGPDKTSAPQTAVAANHAMPVQTVSADPPTSMGHAASAESTDHTDHTGSTGSTDSTYSTDNINNINRTGAAAPARPATPAASEPARRRASDPTDDMALPSANYRYLPADQVDITRVAAALLHGGTHRRQVISGVGNNCWWRAGMPCLLRQTDPDCLPVAMRACLGDAFDAVEPDVAVLCEMAAAARAGRPSIVTAQGRLTVPEGAEPAHVARAENACKSVIRAVLQQGIWTAPEIDRAIDNGLAINGDNAMIAEVFRNMGCTYVCFKTSQSATATSPASPAGIEVEFGPYSIFQHLPPEATLQERTDHLLHAINAENLGVMINDGLHFNLATPLTPLPHAR